MQWNYLHKVNYERRDKLSPTNMLYTPYVSPDGNSLLMHFDAESEYQKYNKKLNKELVKFFFEKELENLQKFQSYNWCPKLIEYDKQKQTILIEFNKETLNRIVTDDNRSLDEYPSWKTCIEKMLTDLYNEGYYKMSLYPHCFFIGQDQSLKTLDFYAVLKMGEVIDREFISGMIGDGSVDRFNFATVDNKIIFDKFFEYTMKYQLNSTWGDNHPFKDMYDRLCNV